MWNARERNLWTFLILLGSVVDVAGIYFLYQFSSTLVTFGDNVIRPLQEHSLSFGMFLCFATSLFMITFKRTFFFKQLEISQNPVLQENRIVWFSSLYFCLESSTIFQNYSAVNLFPFMTLLIGLFLGWASQWLSQPLVTQNRYIQTSFKRLTPILIGTLLISFSLYHLINASGGEELFLVFSSFFALDSLLNLIAVFSRPSDFVPTQYGLFLVIFSSKIFSILVFTGILTLN